ncbi:tetratricopeptide repeat protein [Companilactobacillus nodensis]|uniref:TPR repeats containing protein n=1 Tax=Companilactobacillus nodensis DSM 19682 = JCM 14932 = NBRC 107160 TaxID=1423775 RepID=A0A0R1KAT1_9LACO|nr:tetratricopeptide repeat protein [Companilactobacillus nodensis]KRK80572.1 tPR repeats containing protein [Companilactobacillus nodensis DSM 19682 = JCM 14932 = NBRC 107160]
MTKADEVMDTIDAGDFTNVNSLIKQSLEQDDDQTQFSLAETLMSRGLSVQAKTIYEHLLVFYPDEGQILSRLAEIAVSDGDSDKALDYISQIGPDSPAYAENLLVSADIYQSQGLYEVSEQKLLTGIRNYPDEDVFKFAIAELYFDENLFSKALTYYDMLLDEDITNYSGISIVLRKASSLAGDGQYEDAISEFEKLNAIELNEDAQYQLGFLYNQVKDYNKSISTLEKLLEINHDYPTAYAILAEDYLNIKKNQEAFKYAQLGINLNELDERLYQIAFDAGVSEEPDEAMSIIQKGIKTVETPLPLIIRLSDFYVTRGQYKNNLDLLSGVDINGNPKLTWNLAKSYFETDDVAKAQENILLVLDEYKDNLDYLTDVIEILRSSGDKDALKAALTLYLKQDPDNDEMRDLMDQI